MLINRNNYENFFLLYVDGELSSADLVLVEDFAAANPDLLHELDMLKQTMLPKELIAFDEKNSLFRTNEADELLQEKFLLKIDNELPGNEFATVNSAIANNEFAGREYAQLSLAKLDASEKFVFTDKHLLYRKEKDNVVVGAFLRWAAAAVILGFGIFFGITALNKKNVQGPVAVTVAPVKKVPVVKKILSNNEADIATIIPPVAVKYVTSEKNISKPGIVKEYSAVPEKINKDSVQNIVTNQADQRIVKIPEQSPLLVKKEIGVPRQKKTGEDAEQQLAALAIQNKIKTPAPVDINISPVENMYAKSAALNEEDRSQNKILYMNVDEVNRSKAGGFLRKVKRFVARTAKVKTGNTLRIASFELAAN